MGRHVTRYLSVSVLRTLDALTLKLGPFARSLAEGHLVVARLPETSRR
jgi:hypothetical protein